MAIDASTNWEVRTTGSQNNGGGYSSGGTDYSQQDAAQLNPTDLASTSASSWLTLTSATGGFTAAMVGNIIHITAGTNFTAGWYEITAYTDANTITVDRACGSVADASSGTGNIGGAFLLGGTLDDDFFEAQTAGNTTYIKAGTYTTGESIMIVLAGTAVAPITIEGYNTSRGDAPTGDNRPLLVLGSYDFRLGPYYHLKHFRFTTTALTGVYPSSYNLVFNCKSQNTSATADRFAFYCAKPGVRFVSCEAISDNGSGFRLYADTAINCYAHDCGNAGYLLTSSYENIINSIADTCTTAGIDVNSRLYSNIVGNTIYNCGTVRSAAFPASIALGAPVYVGTTAGDIQAAQPTGVDDVIRRVGWAITVEPNSIYFNPSNDYITHTG